MNRWDLIPALLLTLLSIALASGAAIILLMAHLKRRQKLFFTSELFEDLGSINLLPPHTFSHRPLSWIAVRSRNLQTVQTALGLSNPRPCTWIQGLASDQKLFIAPPINGWILITGCGLPDPVEDVDVCFRFLLELSRKLGSVHFFLANPMLNHHAWARAESGRIIRAYAWAGRTLWNQGVKSQAEIDLGMKCFQYFETADSTLFCENESLSCNAEKVPQLAAQWSIDPAAVDERTLDHACGIAGEPPRLY